MRLCSLLVLIAMFAPLARAQDISTDRPSFANSADVIPARTVQVEVGVGRSSLDDVDRDQLLVSLIRISLASPVELRLGWAGLNRLTRGQGNSISGSGDLSIGTKIRLRSESRRLPSVALVGTFTLPSGDDTFRAREDIPEVALAFGKGLGQRYGLTLNAGAFWAVDDSGDRARTSFYSVSIARSASSSYFIFVEVFGLLAPDSANDTHNLELGLLYPIRENLQADVFLGSGISGPSPDAFFGAGLSLRLPR
jgi:outer membrane putative beta-barrel porin/alpha-amylase